MDLLSPVGSVNYICGSLCSLNCLLSYISPLLCNIYVNVY